MSDQLAMFSTRTAARFTDPETSHEAARDAQRSAATNRDLALLALHQTGERGATDFDLETLTGVKQTSIGKRRGELRDAGLVEQKMKVIDGRTHRCKRPSPSKSLAQVWVCTVEGHDAALRLIGGVS